MNKKEQKRIIKKWDHQEMQKDVNQCKFFIAITSIISFCVMSCFFIIGLFFGRQGFEVLGIFTFIIFLLLVMFVMVDAGKHN